MAKSLAAIIPVAGKGTRLTPITRLLPKAMFPLIGPDGAVRPVAEWIVREAFDAGCDRACFICSDDQQAMLKAYFAGDPVLAGKIEYVTGVPPFGFGYAVWAGKEFAAGSDVLVLLGDHVHRASPGQEPPSAQVAQAFGQSKSAAVVGVQAVSADELRLVGACRGERLAGRMYRCSRIIEKPTPQQTPEIASLDLPAGQFLAHAGIYALSNEIFDHLDELVRRRPEGKEVGLTEAQQMLLTRHPEDYLLYHVSGETYDTGTPENYLATLNALAG
jgi:UTP--glucose-1-phosphate uridylyltransferase